MRAGPVQSRYVVEWYTPSALGREITDMATSLRRTLAAMPADAHRPELLYAVEVPQDSYAFGVFAAESAALVVEACRQAGLPADRVSPAVEAPPSDAAQ